MNRSTLLAVALGSLIIGLLCSKTATAQRYGFFAPELRSVPLLQRPNRPGHFIGNAIRNRAEGSQPQSTYSRRPLRSTPSYRSQPIQNSYQRNYVPGQIRSPQRSAGVSTTQGRTRPVQTPQYGGGYVAQPYNVTINSQNVASGTATSQPAPQPIARKQTGVEATAPANTSVRAHVLGESILTAPGSLPVPQSSSVNANPLGPSILVNP